jgi:RimJ/RimL family protein N-acetyltransferase
MNYEDAMEISKWIYQEPYLIYSMDGSDSCIDELLNGFYFSVNDEESNLLGYYCFGQSAQVPVGKQFGAYTNDDIIDIGLGIKPSLCGQGLGFDFLSHGLVFARSKLSAIGFRLTVASFNERAIKVYKKIGFKKVNTFIRVSENGEIEFWVMTLC